MTAMARTPDGPHRKQRGKNIALLVALLAFVVIVYLVSIVKMGGG